MRAYGKREYTTRLPEFNAERGLCIFDEFGTPICTVEPSIELAEYLLFASTQTLRELKARDAIAGSGINGKKIS